MNKMQKSIRKFFNILTPEQEEVINTQVCFLHKNRDSISLVDIIIPSNSVTRGCYAEALYRYFMNNKRRFDYYDGRFVSLRLIRENHPSIHDEKC